MCVYLLLYLEATVHIQPIPSAPPYITLWLILTHTFRNENLLNVV